MILYRSRFGEATKTKRQNSISGCGSAWLERLVWDQEVAGSNPVTPTTCGCSSMVEHQPSKLDTWVRFPSPALVQGYRSGHNEAVLKTVCPQGRVGSNPTLSVHHESMMSTLGEVPKWLKGLAWKVSRSLIAARGFKSLLLRWIFYPRKLFEKRLDK